MVGELLAGAGVSFSDLEALVVGSGPGSFTGLRIGFSFMKGLACALRIGLTSCSSIAAAAVEFAGNDRIVASLADARSDELFTGIYRMRSESQSVESLVEPTILASAKVSEILGEFGKAGEEVVAVAQEGALPSFGYPLRRPQYLARGLLKLAKRTGAVPPFELEKVALVQPDYQRAVAARTIRERALMGSSAGKNG
jgi:tRNA threonylcarbamoyladenosine biosynthesis protein TsaB